MNVYSYIPKMRITAFIKLQYTLGILVQYSSTLIIYFNQREHYVLTRCMLPVRNYSTALKWSVMLLWQSWDWHATLRALWHFGVAFLAPFRISKRSNILWAFARLLSFSRMFIGLSPSLQCGLGSTLLLTSAKCLYCDYSVHSSITVSPLAWFSRLFTWTLCNKMLFLFRSLSIF